MEIDITQPALSAVAIEQKKAELSVELAKPNINMRIVIQRTLIVGIRSLAIATTINALFGIFTWAAFSLAAVVMAVVMAVVIAVSRLDTIDQKKIDLNRLLGDLSDGGKETSIEIRAWLADEVIATFHQSIVAESRLPMISEVAAMRKRWELRDQRMKDAERKKEVDAAFEELYSNSLVTE